MLLRRAPRADERGGANAAWRGSALAALLDPVAPEELAATYWGRRPLLVRGGAEKLARALPRRLTLPALRAQIARSGAVARVFAYTEIDGVITELPAHGAESKRLEDLGHTQYVANFADVFPDFDAWAAAIRRDLGYPGEFGVTTFFGGATGALSAHFDPFSVFSVQCDGRKRWWLGAEPAVVAPRAALGASGDLERRGAFGRAHPWAYVAVPTKAEMSEAVLDPGDVLYVPSGTWHATASCGEPSLSISLSLHGAPFDELLGRYLRRAIDTVPWRQGLPPSTLELAGGARSASARDLRAFVRARLDEASRALASATPDGVLSAIFESIDPPRAPEGDPAPRPVAPDDVLLLNPAPGGVVSTRTAGGETSVFVHHGGVEIELPSKTAPLFLALVAKRRIRAGDAPSLFDPPRPRWSEVAPLLGLLAAHGIVVVRGEAGPGRGSGGEERAGDATRAAPRLARPRRSR